MRLPLGCVFTWGRINYEAPVACWQNSFPHSCILKLALLPVLWRPPSGPRGYLQVLEATPSSLLYRRPYHGCLLHQARKETLSLHSAPNPESCNIIMRLTSYHYCHIPLVRSNHRSPTHSREVGYIKAWTQGDIGRWKLLGVILGSFHHTKFLKP